MNAPKEALMMKKLLALALCCMMLLGMIGAANAAEETMTFTLKGYKAGAEISAATVTADVKAIQDQYGTGWEYLIYDVTDLDYTVASGTFRKDHAYGVLIGFDLREMKTSNRSMTALASEAGTMAADKTQLTKALDRNVLGSDVSADMEEQLRKAIKLSNPHLSMRATINPGSYRLYIWFDLEPLEGYQSSLQLTMKGYELGAPVNGVTVTAKKNSNELLTNLELREFAIGEKVGDSIDITMGDFKANTTYYLGVLVGEKEEELRTLDKAVEDVPEFMRGWILREVDLTNEYVSEEMTQAYPEDQSVVIWYELKPLEAPVVPATGDEANVALWLGLATLCAAAAVVLRRRFV